MRSRVCKFEDILIYYECTLYLMCIVQNVDIYIFIYVYITVRLVFFLFHSLRQVQLRHRVHEMLLNLVITYSLP